MVELALAMALTAAFTAMILQTIVMGLELQDEAGRLQAARVIAELRLSQLRADPSLEPTEQEGEVNTGLYANMKYRVLVEEQEIDLAEVQNTGEIGGPKAQEEEAGSAGSSGEDQFGGGRRTQTGGVINAFRITVEVTFPVGQREESYKVETLVPDKKFRDAGGG